MAGKAAELGDELKKHYNKSKEAVNDIKEKVTSKAEDVKNVSQTRAN